MEFVCRWSKAIFEGGDANVGTAEQLSSDFVGEESIAVEVFDIFEDGDCVFGVDVSVSGVDNFLV